MPDFRLERENAVRQLAIAGLHLIRGHAIRCLPGMTRAHQSFTIQISLSSQGALLPDWGILFPITIAGPVWNAVAGVVQGHAKDLKSKNLDVALAMLVDEMTKALIADGFLPKVPAVESILPPLVGSPIEDDLASRLGLGVFQAVDL